MNSSAFADLPDELKFGLSNEILYFTKQHRKQIIFGLELIEKTGNRGHYSVCVGASCTAKNILFENGNKYEIEKFANQSIEYFKKYTEIREPPENIYFFVAQAYACLGNLDQSLAYLLKVHINEKIFNKNTNIIFNRNHNTISDILKKVSPS